MIALTFAYYHRGQTLQDQVLDMYASDLADLDAQECMAAYQRYRRNPANKFFPLPAQIRELVNPEEFVSHETQARETAARIMGAITKFGWNNHAEAQLFIGAAGWAVVQRQGGWRHLCENVGLKINPTSFQAQLRDQLMGDFKHGVATIENTIGALPENSARNSGLQNMQGILALIPGGDDDKEGA